VRLHQQGITSLFYCERRLASARLAGGVLRGRSGRRRRSGRRCPGTTAAFFIFAYFVRIQVRPTNETSSLKETEFDGFVVCRELLVDGPLGISELQLLCELTACENLTPCYAADVPPCWSEMLQAQKQRRHPQHLQQGDEAQHTRTWRLKSDS